MGGGHGLYLVINHLWRNLSPRRLPAPAGWALTFIAVTAAWVLFRAPSLDRAALILKSMLSFNTINAATLAAPLAWLKAQFPDHSLIGIGYSLWYLFWDLQESPVAMLLVAAAVAFAAPNAAQIAQTLRAASGKRAGAFSAFAGLLLAYTFLHLNALSEFLYFQF